MEHISHHTVYRKNVGRVSGRDQAPVDVSDDACRHICDFHDKHHACTARDAVSRVHARHRMDDVLLLCRHPV